MNTTLRVKLEQAYNPLASGLRPILLCHTQHLVPGSTADAAHGRIEPFID